METQGQHMDKMKALSELGRIADALEQIADCMALGQIESGEPTDEERASIWKRIKARADRLTKREAARQR